jgi:Zn-dependent peptidase ImmA (M78 family)
MRGDLSDLTPEAFSFSTTHSRTRMEAGFASLTTIYPIILINTEKQSRARRLFTLIHDFAHVLGRIRLKRQRR